MSNATQVISGQHGKTCIAATTKILGDKWTPMLLFALVDQSRRFCDLQTEAGGVNPRTLSARLDGLEEAGIVARQVFPEVPPRVEYSLTDKGRDLLPVLQGMISWADKHEVNC